MKEAVVTAALKLQVAVKLMQDDEKTMRSLRREAFEARKSSVNANKRADSAIELVQALRLEINSLKKQLKRAKSESGWDSPQRMSPINRAGKKILSDMKSYLKLKCSDGIEPWLNC